MNRLISFISIFTLIFSGSVFAENNEETSTRKNTKDTVQALVVNPTNPLYTKLKDMSGEEIIGLVDSLLDADYVPYELVKEINAYAENYILQHDFWFLRKQGRHAHDVRKVFARFSQVFRSC